MNKRYPKTSTLEAVYAANRFDHHEALGGDESKWNKTEHEKEPPFSIISIDVVLPPFQMELHQ